MSVDKVRGNRLLFSLIPFGEWVGFGVNQNIKRKPMARLGRHRAHPVNPIAKHKVK
jgi:hypothetical protein